MPKTTSSFKYISNGDNYEKVDDILKPIESPIGVVKIGKTKLTPVEYQQLLSKVKHKHIFTVGDYNVYHKCVRLDYKISEYQYDDLVKANDMFRTMITDKPMDTEVLQTMVEYPVCNCKEFVKNIIKDSHNYD